MAGVSRLVLRPGPLLRLEPRESVPPAARALRAGQADGLRGPLHPHRRRRRPPNAPMRHARGLHLRRSDGDRPGDRPRAVRRRPGLGSFRRALRGAPPLLHGPHQLDDCAPRDRPGRAGAHQSQAPLTPAPGCLPRTGRRWLVATRRATVAQSHAAVRRTSLGRGNGSDEISVGAWDAAWPTSSTELEASFAANWGARREESVKPASPLGARARTGRRGAGRSSDCGWVRAL